MHTATVAATADKLGEILLRDGLITLDQLKRALIELKQTGMRLGYTLVTLGFVEETEISKMLARQYRMPAVDLSRFEVDPKILRLIPPDVAIKHTVLPLKREGRTLTVAIADPNNVTAIEDIKFITRCDVFPVIAGEYTLRNAIDRYYQQSDAQLRSLLKDIEAAEELEVVEEQREEDVNAKDLADDAPVVKLINGLLTDAVKRGASDVHIEPFEHEVRVRYRVDGSLLEVMKPPIKMRAALTSRVKIMAQLNIAERRVPQDGRIKLKMGSRVIDFRVSTLPVLYGEKIVLRILDAAGVKLGIEALGYEPPQRLLLEEAIKRPYGMILVTGPTGSGKTVSLYTCLNILNQPGINTSTAEDPAEIQLPGVNQVNVNDKAGLNFATALRAFLRQDPDIIMVGEIRDLETAEISVKAAQTGHLVLSTLHTNDAPATLMRLANMGVAAFNIASSVILITAQRLTRKLCVHCKRPEEIPPEALRQAGFTEEDLDGSWQAFGPTGCDACKSTGYKGRMGIYEVMPISDEMRQLIMRNANALDLADQAQKEGVKNLRQSGLLKVKQGLTSLEEIEAVTND